MGWREELADDTLDNPLEEDAYASMLAECMDDPAEEDALADAWAEAAGMGTTVAEPVLYERMAWGVPDPVSVVKRPDHLRHVVDEVVPFAQSQYDSLQDYFEVVHFLDESMYDEGAAHDVLAITQSVPRSVCWEGLPMPRVEGGRFVP